MQLYFFKFNQINSYLKVQGELTYDSTRKSEKEGSLSELEKLKKEGITSFLQISSMVINGEKQWYIVFCKNLRRLIQEEESINDINSKLNPFFNNFYFKESNQSLQSNTFEVVKNIDIGKSFTYGVQAMIEMDFKFVNALWANNTAYIKINNHIYWMENHSWSGVENMSKYIIS